MKHVFCVILLVMLVLTGCGTKGETFTEPVNFYYMTADITYFTAEGVIAPEVREADGQRQDYAYLLKMYLHGPESRELKNAFPLNTTLIQLELLENAAVVTLSDQSTKLTGVDLTIACACLTATVCDMTGVTSVTIQAETQLLDGSQSITMSKEDVLLLDGLLNSTNN